MTTSVRPTDPKLLDLLVAPGSQNPLRYDAEAQELVDDVGGLAFPIRDGIPVMLVDEARVLGDAASAGPDMTPSV
ncbi:Trm112 family protein [Pararhodospirillum photometricum]|uniref:UPF0434 protein RSPPHO_00778 n=1 Tax=Pararhodospirillum photometricum DSM 122 TaxID=1150469 RepID=H6SQT9_PARPM|nr:Trm112 family protein [Pararhodospirillum photometricum]CCG07404.1 Putative uncharacterized protein [Pararhodospirillum photometricum DSM 122]